MLVGYLGDIPFTVSRSFMRTFSEFNRNSTARWSKHDLIGQKPVLEFLGSDIEKISFKMLLRKDKGVTPEDELERLRQIRDTGEVFSLIIDDKPVSDNFWVIESLDESVAYWGKSGQMLSAEVSVTLQEYVGDLT